MNILIVVYLIGIIVSLWCSFKYAEIIDAYKHIYDHYEKDKNEFRLLFFLSEIGVISFVILSYAVMSWIGAIVTYITFNVSEEDN